MSEKLENTNSLKINNVNLKLTNTSGLKPNVYVDGKVLKYKKDNFGNLTTNYSTQKDVVTIEIKKIYDINGPLWFLTSLFFFFISIFGIFDLKPNKRCISIVSIIKVKVNESCSLKIKFKSRTQLETAFELESENCEVLEESGNNYYIDEVAKKRYKIMRIVKISLWIALIAILALLIIKNI